MSTEKPRSKAQSLFVAIVFPLVLVLSVVVYQFVFGDPANFQGNDPVKGHPIDVQPGKLYGTIYKGRLHRADPDVGEPADHHLQRGALHHPSQGRGKGRIDTFIDKVRRLLSNDQVDEAIAESDAQQGSVANVMRSGLEKYRLVLSDAKHDKDTRVEAVKQELDEATALELPMLSKNLVILSTCASISTLLGSDRNGAGDDPFLQRAGHGRHARRHPAFNRYL
jgi:biopolymer transport protein ExbB